MSNFVPVIGIEIHAELKTTTKMFSRSLNDPEETEPNANIDPVNMAHPGTLPVINKKAVEHMINIGLSVDGEIANFTEFDRKNYFYPDIPKGYQISQYAYPIVSGGELAGVKLTRIHLEEDTGTSKHDEGDYTLVDFNRAGVPLMELVTEPVVYTAKGAGDFARELQLLLRYLGASDANMEKGEMRVEANVSLLPTDKSSDELRELYDSDNESYMNMLTTKVEVKNLNSFKSVEKAIEYEVERMQKLYDEGEEGKITQETRGWDENKQKTISQRSKESAEDYRYFPDPDLPKLYLHDLYDLETMKSELPELPWQKRERYQNEYSLSEEAVGLFVENPELSSYFETVASQLPDEKMMKTASNYLTSDYIGIKKENPNATLPDSAKFVTLMNMINESEVSSRGAKDTLYYMVTEGGDPKDIADEKGLMQKSDPEELQRLAQEVIDENPEVVDQYKGGEEKVIKFLMGQVMKKSGGSANPQKAEETLAEFMK